MPIELYPHQSAAVETLGLASTPKRAIVEMTVAGGKSLTMAETARRSLPHGRVVILAHNAELVRQNMKACRMLGLRPQPCSSSVGVSTLASLTVGTIQTVCRRLASFMDVKLILIDEVHLVTEKEAGQYRQLLDALPDVPAYGFTGTPFRANGGSIRLAEIFGPVVYSYAFGDALRDGRVKPIVAVATVEAPASISTDGVKVSASGEWSETELSHRGVALAPDHARAIAATLDAHGRSRAIGFCCDIEHADALAAEFPPGQAAAVHSRTPDKDAVIARFRDGRGPRLLLTVNAFSTGFDVPDIDAVVMIRPVRSVVYYIQSLGRGARKSSVSADAVFIDLGGNLARHGAIDMVNVPEGVAVAPVDVPKEARFARLCKGCLHEYLASLGPTCPSCGFNSSQFRTVGSGLTVGAKAGVAVTAMLQRRWEPLTGAPVKVPGRPIIRLPTRIGQVLWPNAAMPGPATHAYVGFDPARGMMAFGVMDEKGAVHGW